MPIFGQESKEMQTQAIAEGAFEFSGARPETLTGASEYTLTTIVCDITGSVIGFEDILLKAIKDSVSLCKRSAAADNLLVRYVNFAERVEEVHGFQLLRSFDPQRDYSNLRCGGNTALFDAVYESITATNAYAKTLTDKDFTVNGVIFIPTDGDDNASRIAKQPSDIKDAVIQAMRDEYLESLVIILIGVNAKRCSKYLDRFHQEAGLTQFVNIEDFQDDSTGARLAGFISKSTSSQSQALGTGGPSQSLSF